MYLRRFLMLLGAAAAVALPADSTESDSDPTIDAQAVTPHACPTKASCAVSGFGVSYYANGFYQYGRNNGVLSNYYVVDGLSALKTDKAKTIGLALNKFPNLPTVRPNASVSGNPYYWVGWKRQVSTAITVDANNFTLVYTGFLKPKTTGNHLLCGRADDEIDYYVGNDVAFDCSSGKPGTAANRQLAVIQPSKAKCATVALKAGSSYPIRIVYGNTGGVSSLSAFYALPAARPTYKYD